MATQYIEKRSGMKDSGKWDAYSEWYEVCSDPIPAGYKIDHYKFHLEGDRQCGAWANCRLKSEAPDRVCWEFQLQGHNEGGPFHIGNPNDGIRRSEGVLEIWISN